MATEDFDVGFESARPATRLEKMRPGPDHAHAGSPAANGSRMRPFLATNSASRIIVRSSFHWHE